MANPIFGAMEGWQVHWRRVIAEVVTKLADHVAKVKQSLISPYLFHLYHRNKVLTDEEATAYQVGVSLLEHNLIDEV